MITAGQRLVNLAGSGGQAGALLRQIGVTGGTAGALLVNYSGLSSATAAVHLLFERLEVRGGGSGGNRFVEGRKRLALQRALDFLTSREPEEETKQIIREIKAGKPAKPDKHAPVVMREVSAEKLADKIIPSRIAQLPPDIDLQQVIRRAIEIAQDRDDEEALLLLL